MRASIFSSNIGAIYFLATLCSVSGQATSQASLIQQSATSPSTQTLPSTQTTLQAFEQEQQVLFEQRRALVASGATDQQLQAWYQQNTAQFIAQQQRAQAVATAEALQFEPTNRQATIPSDASPTLQDFLTTQVALANARAQLHNQIVQQALASGASVTPAQASQMEQQESQLFQQQNASLLTLQVQRSQALALTSTQTVRPVPPVIVIPPGTTPQLAAYLITLNEIKRSRVQLSNQYANASTTAREAALEAWREQNAALFAQLQQQAQNLSTAIPTTQN